MAAVPEDQRINELRRLGASEPLIRLSSGEVVHELFRYSCLGPPHYVYHGAGTPFGPPLIPLWDCNDTVVGVWEWWAPVEPFEAGAEGWDRPTGLAVTEVPEFASLWTRSRACVRVIPNSLASCGSGLRLAAQGGEDRDHLQGRLSGQRRYAGAGCRPVRLTGQAHRSVEASMSGP